VTRDLDSDSEASGAKSVLRHVSHGVGYYYQHDCLCVRDGWGTWTVYLVSQ
jgi:hypothetical protein